MFAAPDNFRDSEKGARRHAARLVHHALRHGLKLEMDDAFSEVSMIWVRCKRAFDPSHGVRFETYWHRAVDYDFRNIMQKNVDRALAFADRVQTSGKMDRGSESAEHGLFAIQSSDISPENEAIRRLDMLKASQRAPLFLRLLKLCEGRHPEILKEIAAAKAQVEYARSMGIKLPIAHQAMTPAVLMRVLRMNWRSQAVLRKEMKELAKYV